MTPRGLSKFRAWERRHGSDSATPTPATGAPSPDPTTDVATTDLWERDSEKLLTPWAGSATG